MRIKVFDTVLYNGKKYRVKYIENESLYLSRIFKNGNSAITVCKVDSNSVIVDEWHPEPICEEAVIIDTEYCPVCSVCHKKVSL